MKKLIAVIVNVMCLNMVFGQEVLPPLTTIERDNAWMAIGIIFIILFALAVMLAIYLWILRLRKINEFNRYVALQEQGLQNKQNRNVWYGGGGSHI